MADIRIKDLATTASTTASDDFLAVDGTTNGTRKLSAATPSFATSVTVPGVAGPTATNLTLTGGSTGASLVLGQGAAATATLTVNNAAGFTVTKATGNAYLNVTRASKATGQTALSLVGGTGGVDWILYQNANSDDLDFFGNSANRVRMTSTGNVLIGGTTDIPGSGGLKVFGTTAASSTASGALQVAGGVGVAGTGFFGSNVVSSGYFSAAPGTGDFRFNQQSFQRAAFAMGGSHIGYGYNSRYDGSSATVPATDSTGTMSSIASTASGISIFTNTSQVANTPGVERLSVSSAGITSLTNSTASTGVGTGALQVAGGIYAGAASVFGGTIATGGSSNSAYLSINTNELYNTAGPVTVTVPDNTGGFVTVVGWQSGVGKSSWTIPYVKHAGTIVLGTAIKSIITADPITGAAASSGNISLTLFAANTNLKWGITSTPF